MKNVRNINENIKFKLLNIVQKINISNFYIKNKRIELETSSCIQMYAN